MHGDRCGERQQGLAHGQMRWAERAREGGRTDGRTGGRVRQAPLSFVSMASSTVTSSPRHRLHLQVFTSHQPSSPPPSFDPPSPPSRSCHPLLPPTYLRTTGSRERAPAQKRGVRNLTLTRTHLTSQGCRASSCSISPVDRTTLEAVLRALLSTCCMNGQRQRVSQRAEGLSRWGARDAGFLPSRPMLGVPQVHQ